MKIRLTKMILWFLAGFGFTIVLLRILNGPGSVTVLTDIIPWGLWKGWGVVALVPIGGAGFTLAMLVHIFQIKRYTIGGVVAAQQLDEVRFIHVDLVAQADILRHSDLTRAHVAGEGAAERTALADHGNPSAVGIDLHRAVQGGPGVGQPGTVGAHQSRTGSLQQLFELFFLG